MLPVLISIVLVACATMAASRFKTPAQPAWPSRVFGLIAAFTIATSIAAFQAFVFEADSCVDAGGALRPSGYCELGPRSDPYVPQLARPAFTHPGIYFLWLAFIINVFVPGWAVYHLVIRALRRGARG